MALNDNSQPAVPQTEFSLRNVIKSKFASDWLFGFASVLLLGVCGLVVNFIIATKYGTKSLGLFNLVFAIYIFFSQLGTLGIQSSSLKHVAEFSEDDAECNTIIVTSLVIMAILASAASILLFSLRFAIASLFRNADVATGLLYATPGLWCFVMNKLLLNVLNGFRDMKAYSFFVSLRYLAMIAALLAMVSVGVQAEKLSSIFSVAEVVLFFALATYSSRLFSFWRLGNFREWIRRHLTFGFRSLLSGVTSELKTRTNVLILGYFWSDWHVGIFSFAAFIVEGVMQIPYVLKLNMDPILAKLIASGNMRDMKVIIHKGRKWTSLSMLGLGAVLVCAFPLIVQSVVNNNDFSLAWPVFTILMAGAILQGGYIPFSGILAQGGFPGAQSLLMLLMTLSNILLNFLLVPMLGINGSAIATFLSFVVFVLTLKALTRRAFNINL